MFSAIALMGNWFQWVKVTIRGTCCQSKSPLESPNWTRTSASLCCSNSSLLVFSSQSLLKLVWFNVTCGSSITERGKNLKKNFAFLLILSSDFGIYCKHLANISQHFYGKFRSETKFGLKNYCLRGEQATKIRSAVFE